MKVESLCGDQKPSRKELKSNKAVAERFKESSNKMDNEGMLKLEIMLRLRDGIIQKLERYDLTIVELYATQIAHQTCMLTEYFYEMTRETRESTFNRILETINNLTIFLRENFNITLVTKGLNDLIEGVIQTATRK